jgi:23S rRNA pseudouridine1911/1915/1917 synthase
VRVHYEQIDEPETTARPRTLHEDGSILVVEKPAGLLVHPTHTCLRNNVVHLLRAQYPGRRIALAHRLDRETSGLLLVALTPESSRVLAVQFASGSVGKTYLALVHGIVDQDGGTIDRPLGVCRQLDVLFRQSTSGIRSRTARTDFRVLRRYDRYTLLEALPRTGRRHQIRAHLAEMGHPIVGDKLYSTDGHFYLRMIRDGLTPSMRDQLLARRQLLHASRIRFTHPLSGRRVQFSSSLPDDFQAFLDGLDS